MKRAKSEKFQTKLTDKASLAHKNLQNRKIIIQKVMQKPSMLNRARSPNLCTKRVLKAGMPRPPLTLVIC